MVGLHPKTVIGPADIDKARSWAKIVLEEIDQSGIPAPWQDFGQMLARDSTLSMAIVEEVTKSRLTKNRHPAAVRALYQRKADNLQAARILIQQTVDQYDAKGTWRELDEVMTRLPIDEFALEIEDGLSLHPFPIVMESLRFNWRYMCEHGIRDFYMMTYGYLDKLLKSCEQAMENFESECRTNRFRHRWLISSDLISIEAPCHCSVCRSSIAPILIAWQLRLA